MAQYTASFGGATREGIPMRTHLALVVPALLLTACSDYGSWLGDPDTSTVPDRPVVASTAPAGTPHTAAHCDEAARARATAAADQGFEDSVMHAVYRETYANCMQWASRH